MPLGLEQVARQLVERQLVGEAEVRAAIDALGSGEGESAEPLVELLVRGGQLSQFQGTHVLAGKAASLTVGDYVVIDRIAIGGMGQVFKARRRRMKRLVAIKVIGKEALRSPEAVQRFRREVEASARLVHPNIVTAFDAGEDRGTHYLVMEYVDGRDLATTLALEGRLPVERALDYIIQAARGLAYAHAQGVVHRDIKPGNLLVDREGTVKILDMGLARLAEGGEEEQLTRTGQVMGTVNYMAPEQGYDTHEADARSDIYSLGCTLYRLLAGEDAFDGETMVDKLLAHRRQSIPSLAARRTDVPAALDDVFRKMVAKQAEDRYQTVEDLIAALEAVRSGRQRGEAAAADGGQRGPIAAALPAAAIGSGGRASQLPLPVAAAAGLPPSAEGRIPVARAAAVAALSLDKPAATATRATPRRGGLWAQAGRRKYLAAAVGMLAVAVVGVALWGGGGQREDGNDVAGRASGSEAVQPTARPADTAATDGSTTGLPATVTATAGQPPEEARLPGGLEESRQRIRQLRQAGRHEEAHAAIVEARRQLERLMDEGFDENLVAAATALLVEQAGEGWHMVTPVEMGSTGGATLTVEADQSVFVSGFNPSSDVYVLSIETELDEVHGVRLETLPDERLPNGASGRFQGNGNFHLGEILVAVVPADGEPQIVRMGGAIADVGGSGGRTIRRALDGNAATHWSPYPAQAERHEAVLAFAEPIQRGAGTTRLVVMLDTGVSQFRQHGIGKFRLSLAPDRLAVLTAWARLSATADDAWFKLALACHLAGDEEGTAAMLERHRAAGDDGNIVIEVEDAAVIDPPWQVVVDRKAAGGRAVAATKVSGFTNRPDDAAQLQFTFSAAEPGPYHLFGRFLGPDGNSDSVWVSVDGGEWIHWSRQTGRQWGWSEGLGVALPAGTHTVRIAPREGGVALDRLLVSRRSSVAGLPLAEVREGCFAALNLNRRGQTEQARQTMRSAAGWMLDVTGGDEPAAILAATALDEVYDGSTSNVEVLAERAGLLEQVGRPAAAEETYGRLDSLEPDRAEWQVRGEQLREAAMVGWNFDGDAEGWKVEQGCNMDVRDGALAVRATGEGASIACNVFAPAGCLELTVRARADQAASLRFAWSTESLPFGYYRDFEFRVGADGTDWQTQRLHFFCGSPLTGLRLGPMTPGEVEIDAMWLRRVSVDEALARRDEDNFSFSLLRSRGMLLGGGSRWEAALDEFRRMEERWAENTPAAVFSGPLHLACGDQAGYVAHRRRVLERFADANLRGLNSNLARSALVLPAEGDDLARATALIDRVVSAMGVQGRFQLWIKALAEYRAGRFGEAQSWLERTARTGTEPSRHRQAQELLLAAMAHHRLERADQARTALEQARQIIDGPPQPWLYGYGELDEGGETVARFEPFAYWSGTQWRAAATLPSATHGLAHLRAEGGCPGPGKSGAVIRRWVAARDGSVTIKGTLAHRDEAGDGVRGRIVSSRDGTLGEWRVRKTAAQTNVVRVTVRKADSIDFVVDQQGDNTADSFTWTVGLGMDDGAQAMVWDSVSQFAGPREGGLPRLDGGTLGDEWPEAIIVDVLRREAEALILGSPPSGETADGGGRAAE